MSLDAASEAIVDLEESKTATIEDLETSLAQAQQQMAQIREGQQEEGRTLENALRQNQQLEQTVVELEESLVSYLAHWMLLACYIIVCLFTD